MVQKVQSELTYIREIEEIQGVWYSQRKISDRTQVRDRRTTSVVASTSIDTDSVWDFDATTWTLSSTWWIDYKSSEWTIYIPLGWIYQITFSPTWWYSQTWYYYTVNVSLNWDVVLSKRNALWTMWEWSTTVNCGKRDEITVSITTEYSAASTLDFNVTITQL